jgi:hypothetical protein
MGGAPQDLSAAAAGYWVRAAAGDRRARFILAAIDDNGRGVPPASRRGEI